MKRMEKNTILISIITLLIGGIVGYTISNHDRENYRGGIMNEYSHDLDTSAHMDHSMMMVSNERAFIEGMIPHHQEAVDTAKEVIARGGTTPEIKQLVENIVVAQEKEIAEMKVWYETWYKESYKDDGKYSPMMRELSNLSGKELDRVFLEDMIMHHMGALMMARSVQPHIEHQEMTNLTEAILSTQTAEITLMKKLLAELN